MNQVNESVTEWVLRLQETGDEEAAQQLYQRYMTQLVDLARHKLRNSPKTMADEEDVAIVAFEQFCRGAQAGRFPKLHDRDDLWQVLIMLTERRAIDQLRKRKRTTGESSGVEIGQIASREPTPALVSEVLDQLKVLVQSLDDEQVERVMKLKPAAHSNIEIAAELKCSVRTVNRKLRMIRERWERVSQKNSNTDVADS